LNFTWAGLADARASIKRVREAWGRVVRVRDGQTSVGTANLAADVEKANAAFTAALADDLNTSEALAAVFALVSAVNRSESDADSAAKAAAAFARFEDVLAVYGDEPSAVVDAPPELREKALARDVARAAKDFAEADRLRDELAAAGYRIIDTPDGPRLERT
jgi:cysteinyl-tRNA synthetase